MADIELTSGLRGAQAAAVFLLGVGEEPAAAIMRHLEPREVQRIGEAMATLSGISNEQVEAVMRDFKAHASAINPLGLGAQDFTRRVLVHALGESKARSMISKVMPDSDQARGVDSLRWMDASVVANILEGEHPQIIAIVLATLDEEQAAQILVKLPEDLRGDVLLRVAQLEVIDPAAMEELDKVLEKQLGKTRRSPSRAVNGANSAAAILNRTSSDIEASVLASIKEADANLGERVSELMFVFENLMGLDDRGMQRLIREIAVDQLVIALKGVEEAVQERFFSNMSQRAAEMLREDLEAKGPVKVSEVESVQKDILAVARRLADEGEIALRRGSDDFV